MKWLWMVLGTLCYATGCVAEADSTGGKTNWVECDTDDDCADVPNTSCVERVCTQRADSSTDGSEGTDGPDQTEDVSNDSSSESTSAEDTDVDTNGIGSEGPDGAPPRVVEASTGDDTSHEASTGDDTLPDEENCFSPTSNVEQVYACGIEGCACDSPNDAAAVCISGDDGNNYALRCTDGQWYGVDNSQCAVDEDRCFDLTTNVDLATSGTIRGCECPASCAEETCEECGIGQGEYVPMKCLGDRWQVASLDDCDGLARDLCSVFVGDDGADAIDAGKDAGTDSSKDAGTDAGMDAGLDAAR